MIDKGMWVDGIWVIQDYTNREQIAMREQIEQEKQEERKPKPCVPLTKADELRRWNRRMKAQHEADLRRGIDRS